MGALLCRFRTLTEAVAEETELAGQGVFQERHSIRHRLNRLVCPQEHRWLHVWDSNDPLELFAFCVQNVCKGGLFQRHGFNQVRDGLIPGIPNINFDARGVVVRIGVRRGGGYGRCICDTARGRRADGPPDQDGFCRAGHQSTQREGAGPGQKGGAAVEGLYRIDEQSRNGIGQHDSICGVRPQIGDTDGIGERFGGGNRLGAGGFHDR